MSSRSDRESRARPAGPSANRPGRTAETRPRSDLAPPHASIAYLHRTCGNRAVQRAAGNQAVGQLFAGRPRPNSPQIALVSMAASRGLGNQAIQRLVQDILRANEAPDEELGAALPVHVQRKVQVKGGQSYATPVEGIDKRFERIVKSGSVYLAQSAEDVESMKTGQDAPLLAPRKHLIGEAHHASQFTNAVRDWAWGAELLIEAYGEHERLRDEAKEKKQEAPTGNEHEKTMWIKAKALEDRAAKALTDLTGARIFGNMLLKLTKANPDDALKNPGELKNFCGTVWQKSNLALNVATELARYLNESSKERGWGIIGSYFKEHELVQKTVTEKLINQLGAGLDNIKEQFDDVSAFHLSTAKIEPMLTHVDTLIPVLQRLVVAYDPKGLSIEAVKAATGEAISTGKIGHLSPLRERYMRQRIEQAAAPALVKIGAEHVANLRDNLPARSLAFNDYAAFLARNRLQGLQDADIDR